jgi:O-antigen ligase
MGGSNYIAWVLATSFGWMLYKAIRGQRWERVLACSLLPLWIAAIVATGSRGGLLCLAVSGMVCLLLTRQVKAVALTSALAAALYFLAPAAYLERISTITADPDEMDTSALSRYQNMQIGFEIIRDHPLFGTGLDTFPTAKLQYVRADYVGAPQTIAHNTFIQMASEAGLPVLLFFLGINAWIAWRLVRRSRDSLDAQSLSHLDWVRVGVLCAVAASLVEMVKGDIAHMDYLWWLYGIAACACGLSGRTSQPAVGRFLPSGTDPLVSPGRA